MAIIIIIIIIYHQLSALPRLLPPFTPSNPPPPYPPPPQPGLDKSTMEGSTEEAPPTKLAKQSSSSPSSSSSPPCLFVQSLTKGPVYDTISSFTTYNDMLRVMETTGDMMRICGARAQEVTLAWHQPSLQSTTIPPLLQRRPGLHKVKIASHIRPGDGSWVRIVPRPPYPMELPFPLTQQEHMKEQLWSAAEAGFAHTMTGFTEALRRGCCKQLEVLHSPASLFWYRSPRPCITTTPSAGYWCMP